MTDESKDKSEEKSFREELLTQLLNLSTAGFGLVAALAWNEVVQNAVKDYLVPKIPGSGLVSQLIYALIVTILAVMITYHLSKLIAKIHGKKS